MWNYINTIYNVNAFINEQQHGCLLCLYHFINGIQIENNIFYISKISVLV